MVPIAELRTKAYLHALVNVLMGNLKMATTGATISNTLNPAELCKTTGWYNNCGLNSLTHFLYAKLSAIPADVLPHFLEQNPEYDALLATFKRYYDLDKAITWQDVLGLLRDHPVPTDREAIFAPVLRAHLGKIIAQSPNESWGYDAIGAISDYIKNGRVEDVAEPFYASNKEFYDSMRADYQRALANNLKNNATEIEIQQAIIGLIEKNENPFNKNRIPNYKPEGVEILLSVIEYRKIQIESEYNEAFQNNWLEQGCRRYADYVANMNNAVMVTAPHLTHLCEALNIGVEVYSPAGLASAPQRQFPWLFKVLNSGLHWTFEEPNNNNEARTLHNRHYEVGRTNEMLGKYKIHTGQAASKDRMIAEVRCLFGEMKVEELEELKQVELLAAQLVQASLKPATSSTSLAAQSTTLKLHVQAILESSKEGKDYIQMILANKDLLKLVNEQFDVALTCTFIQSYGAIVEKVKSRNAATQVAFFEGFLKQARLKALSEVGAVLSGTAPLPAVVTTERVGMKLAYLAILQQDEFAKQMVEPIEKNADVLKAFNAFSEQGVRAFVQFCHIPAKFAGLLKLTPAKLQDFLQRFEGVFLPKSDISPAVKPQ